MVQLQLFEEQSYNTDQTLSLLEVLAKISAWQETEQECKDSEVHLYLRQLGLLKSADQTFLSGKMLKEHSVATLAETLRASLKPLPTYGIIASNGNCLIQHGYYPKIGAEFTLSDILQEEVPETYFLSEKQIESLLHGNQKPQLLMLSNEAAADIIAE